MRKNFVATQFDGESDWDAVINSASLDIVEEDEFEAYLVSNGESKESRLEILEHLLRQWEKTGARE